MTKRRGARIPFRLASEQALLRHAVAGDERAFDEVFRRHHQEIFRYCRSILGNEQDAMDALQNTMTKALKRLPGETRKIRLKPWLFRVAHNESIDVIRSRRTVAGMSEIEAEESRGVESEVTDRERLRQLLADIAHLPDAQRSALVMRELNGLEFEEVGLALGSSAAAARQQVYEARLALQEQQLGRDMRCEDARQTISANDGRVLRARKLRAHLRSCDDCEAFRTALTTRQQDLRCLVPVIPAATAASILGALGGGSGGGFGGGLLALFGGSSASVGAGAKAVAIVAVTAGLGAGTIGVVESGRSGKPPQTQGSPQVGSVSSDESIIPASLSGPGQRYQSVGTDEERPDRDGHTLTGAVLPEGSPVWDIPAGEGRPGSDRNVGSGASVNQGSTDDGPPAGNPAKGGSDSTGRGKGKDGPGTSGRWAPPRSGQSNGNGAAKGPAHSSRPETVPKPGKPAPPARAPARPHARSPIANSPKGPSRAPASGQNAGSDRAAGRDSSR